MKKVTMYKADDGTLFKTARAATNRDNLLKEIKEVVKLIGGYPKDPKCDFANGRGYYQLTKDRVFVFEVKLLSLVQKYEPWVYRNYGKGTSASTLINSGNLMRSLCDSDSPLYGTLLLRHCIDFSFRRWGQPYYADHPEEGTQVKLGELK